MFTTPVVITCFVPQCVEVYACRLRPIDRDTDWSVQAETKMSEALFNKTLEGRVVLALGNTLWLDPLYERELIMGEYCTTLRVRDEIKKNVYAEPNPQVRERPTLDKW